MTLPFFTICRLFFFNHSAPTEIYTLSLHDALPISCVVGMKRRHAAMHGCDLKKWLHLWMPDRSEEHTSELQSRQYLVCRLLLEKKKKRRAKDGLRQKLVEQPRNASGGAFHPRATRQ